MTPPRRRFSEDLLARFDGASYLFLKAGAKRHRPTALWMVVVDRRVFVRSWSDSPHGWYRALIRDPIAVVHVAKHRLHARAVRTRSERTKRRVSQAYLEKYGGSSMRRYAVEMGRPSSRATTIELVPTNSS